MRLSLRAITVPWAAVLCVSVCSLAPSTARASTVAPAPALEAPEAILVEPNTDTVIYALHPNRRVAIASTTKLMTAYVTLEDESLAARLVEQPYRATAGQSLAGLPAGASYSVADLLRAMLLPSGNDVAHTLAIDVGHKIAHFIVLMNAAAAQLGLTDTHYSTPVGLDTPGNYSTAANLETLAQVLMHDAFFAHVVREQVAYLPGGIEVQNTNDLLSYPFVVGIKTGHTQDAGYCLVGAARRHGVYLISVVLGDPSEAARDADTLALLRYGLYVYHRVHVALKGHAYREVPINGSKQTVALVAARRATLIVRRASGFRVSFAGVPAELEGPLPAGTVEGRLEASDDGKLVATVPLVTQVAVADPPASRTVFYVLAIIVLGVAGGCSLRVMRRRGSGAPRRRLRA